MKKPALILSFVLCASAFSQTYPETITGEVNWSLLSPNKYTHYYVKNGTITVSSSPVTADTINKTFILLGDCNFKLGNALFNSDHDFNFTGEGALSFEGVGDLDIGTFSVKANSTTEVKSISVKKTTVSFYDGSTVSFGKYGADCAINVTEGGGVTVQGKVILNLDTFRKAAADTHDGSWDLAKVDETSHFIFNYQTCVVTSDLGNFEIESGTDKSQTYLLKSGYEEWRLTATGNYEGIPGTGSMVLTRTVPEAAHFAAVFGAAILIFAVKRRK